MENQKESQANVVTLERPTHHYALLIAPDGSMLGLNSSGDLAMFDEADDRVIWDRTANGVKHVATNKDIEVDIKDHACTLLVDEDEITFSLSHGPEKLPSEYLEHLMREGWVCLNSIIPPETVEGLERVACTDRYEHLEQNTDIPKICQDAAVAKALVEPVSLWLLRQYLQTKELHLGHSPGFGIVEPNKLARAGRGWHSDIPYTPSRNGLPVADRKGPPLACNRNVCVSDFTELNGATMFKLGSHKVDARPPEAWNAPLKEDKPPYSGPEATVFEAPSGSIALYDSRTWHRAGYNRSEHKRGAMLQSVQTPSVVPKGDTKPACEKLQKTPVFEELNARQQRDVVDLLMNQPEIPQQAAQH